jgi:uncharacterized damage-inducible protein DinB
MPTVAELFLSHSTAKLTQMTGLMETCVLKLTPTQVWTRSSNAENSIGNLILHLCGNVRQWIGSSIGGQPDIRERDQEFALTVHLDTAELLGKLNHEVSNALSILDTLPRERLTEMVATRDGDRTVLEVIYQVVGHFQQHAGQIVFATKLLTGQDLKFYSPPKKNA